MGGVPTLVCPECGEEQDPRGPGVASWHPDYDDSKPWKSVWVPFIEDLRGTPTRLVHPRCFVGLEGLDALVDLIHANDERMRLEISRQRRQP
jgi:hypothetical protein